MKSLILVCVAGALAGCATDYSVLDAQIERERLNCYTAEVAQDAVRQTNCLLDYLGHASEREAAERRDTNNRAGWAAAFMSAGQGVQQSFQNATPQPLNCVSNQIGRMTYTNCY